MSLNFVGAPLLLAAMGSAGPVPGSFHGVWSGAVTKGVLGPRSQQLKDKGNGFFVVSEPDAQGDVYFKQEDFRQLFRIRSDGVVQYCANEIGHSVTAATFEVAPSSGEDQLDLCWRGPRLPSHKANCTGCDCAHWTLSLVNGTLHSTMLMSPPVVHMQVALEKTGAAPAAADVAKAFPCEISNSTGNVPTPSPVVEARSPSAGLAMYEVDPVLTSERLEGFGLPSAELGAHGEIKNCLMLNLEHNVRLAYTVPELPCSPCSVTFELSMDTPKDRMSYVALAFKDHSASYLNSSMMTEIPNYWGMAGDGVGDLSGRMVVGYVGTNGTKCIRQMEAESYTSAPVDVPEDGLIRSTTVTSHDGRTTVGFEADFHAGTNALDLNGIIGNFSINRFAWAMGSVGGDGSCSAQLEYHDEARGVAPLGFPWYARMCHCGFPSVCVDPWPLIAAAAGTPPMLDSDLTISV